MDIQTQALLQRLKANLPERAAGIRTDYSVTTDGASRRALIVEAFGRKNAFVLVSPFEKIRARAIQIMVDNVGVKADAAIRCLEAAHELTEINDVGAWTFQERAREARRMTKRGIGDLEFGAIPGAEDLWLTISANLGSIERIEIIETIDAQPGRGGARKAYANFYTSENVQVAAIQLNLLSRQVRDMAFPASEEDGKNADRRTRRWANQVGADQRAFTAAMIALLSIDNYFAPTEINLSL